MRFWRSAKPKQRAEVPWENSNSTSQNWILLGSGCQKRLTGTALKLLHLVQKRGLEIITCVNFLRLNQRCR